MESVLQKLMRWKVNNPGKVPSFVKPLAIAAMRATSGMREIPNFLIIGFQKCSTTSLYSYLSMHPSVRMSIRKEVNYFGCHTGQGLHWYRSHFPIRSRSSTARTVAVGEASTIYAFSPAAAKEAFDFCPEFKLIAILRDPVARTISHYHHRRKNQREHRSMEEAIESALNEFESHLEAWNRAANTTDPSYEEPYSSYVLRSHYSLQIGNWRKHFPNEQILLIRAESLWNAPVQVFDRVQRFLGIEHHPLATTETYNAGTYDREKSPLEERLVEHFRDEYAWLEQHCPIEMESQNAKE